MSKLRAVSLAPLRVSRTPFRKVDLDPDKRRNRQVDLAVVQVSDYPCRFKRSMQHHLV